MFSVGVVYDVALIAVGAIANCLPYIEMDRAHAALSETIKESQILWRQEGNE